MELSSAVLQGLVAAGSSGVSDVSYTSLVESVVQVALGLADNSVIDAIDGDKAVLKEALAGVLGLLVEGARTNTDPNMIGGVLEECKWIPDRISTFVTAYKEHKDSVRATLSRVCSTLPHVVDVNWRLDYHIKNNHLEKLDKPVFLIELTTQQGGATQFACSQEQLQDLVSKLRDATKSVERFSQQM